MSKHEDLIICECHSTDHQIIFLYDDEWDRIFMHIHISPNRGFWKRLWFGLKYAFGYRSKFGEFDEIVLKPEDVYKFQKIVNQLNIIHNREILLSTSNPN